MNSLINPDDEDIKNKINKNLDIFLELNEEMKVLIECIINKFDKDVDINREEFIEYLFKDFKKFCFKLFKSSFCEYYVNITDNEISHKNSQFSEYINVSYDLSKEKNNNYLEIFKSYIREINLNMDYKKNIKINPYLNLYLINKINNSIKDIRNDYGILNNSIKDIRNDYKFHSNSIKDNYELINNSIIDNMNNYRYLIRYIKKIKEENKMLRFFMIINLSLILVILSY